MADRIGCLDSDGDGYLMKEMHPFDASRYEAEVEVDNPSSGISTTVIIIGVVIAILALIEELFLPGEEEMTKPEFCITTTGSPPVAMPDFSAQPARYECSACISCINAGHGCSTCYADMSAQPAVVTPVNDPAATDYYNGLIS